MVIYNFVETRWKEMISKNKILIGNIPTLIWGSNSDRVYIFVHGKMGCKEDAEHFAEIAVLKGYQVVSFDLPEHGERKDEDYPIMVWNGVNDLKCISDYVTNKWKEVNLYACSLGAYFSLLAFKDIDISKSLFQCPLLNMERLVANMMKWFNITEEQLEVDKEIPTPIGETLYWDYWVYAKEHPVNEWKSKSFILYPSNDGLTERQVIDDFVKNNLVHLTVLEGAEHFFTEQEYLEQTELWLQTNI